MPSCLRVWVVSAVQQVFEETIAEKPGANVDWAAQRGEAEHVQIALRCGIVHTTVSIIRFSSQH